jgi:MFS family permease
VAGVCIASLGLAWTFTIDFMTFAVSIFALFQIKSMPPSTDSDERPRLSLKSVHESLVYAWKRQELLGTYLVDFIAMIFAMPNALFPAIAVLFGGTKTLGWLYVAPAIGALIMTLFSAWTTRVKRHGACVVFAATIWGGAIACAGFSHSLIVLLTFLVIAGAADCVSGIFRTTIWNETIPDALRGRMAGLEMISYMSGPALGNTQMGLLASLTGTQMAISLGGMFCVLGVFLSVCCLPLFWRYQPEKSEVVELISS